MFMVSEISLLVEDEKGILLKSGAVPAAVSHYNLVLLAIV